MNDKTTKYLQLHWLSLSTIPKHWETIQLTSVSNVGQWGTLLEITNQICEEVKTQCVAIAKKVWLVVVWIDIITTDLSVPLHVSWGTIIEINAAPWFWWDQTFSLVNTPKLLLEHIFN
jgi:cyanophycin synthetase